MAQAPKIYRCRSCGGHMQKPQKHRRLVKFMRTWGIKREYAVCGTEGFDEVEQPEVTQMFPNPRRRRRKKR